MVTENTELRIQELQEETENVKYRIEILYLLRGEVALKVNQENIILQKDDIHVFNVGDSVEELVLNSGLAARLYFKHSFFSKCCGIENFKIECSSTQNGMDVSGLRKLFHEILVNYFEQKGKDSFLQKELACKIGELLVRKYLVKGAPADRIQQVLFYIQENYNGEISLAEAASRLYVSESHLSRAFKQETGINFMQYVMKMRLKHAVEELKQTDLSILQIANDSGFSSLAMFNKAFKEHYGETPSEYRGKYKKQELGNLSEEVVYDVLRDNLAKRNLVEEQISKISVEADTRTGEVCETPWQKMINIGPAADLMDQQVQKHILLLKEKLDFEYVRIWGIFHENMRILPFQKGERPNFRNLDRILEFLLENRIRPFFQIGPKPFDIYGVSRKTGGNRNEEIADYTPQEWEKLLFDLLEHLVKHFTQKEVEHWIFEMWSPYPRDGVWYQWYQEACYAALYRAVHRYAPRAKTGGGEFDICNEERIRNSLECWKQMEVCPDFISLSGFPYRGENSQMQWVTDPDFLIQCLKKVGEIKKECGLEDTAVYVSAWNNTISNRSLLNDTVYKGSYIIKNAIDSMKNGPEILGYWVYSDMYSDYTDSRSVLFGGAGLLSRDGIMKPAGYAFLFLKKMKEKLICRGTNYAVTGDGNNHYTIIYHNLKRLNYAAVEKSDCLFHYEELSELFLDSDQLEIHFVLKEMESERVNVRIQRVEDGSGSILDEWEKLGGYPELSGEDLEYMKQISVPSREMFRVSTEHGKIELQITVPANGFGIIEIFDS